MKQYDVIIVNYNGEKIIQKCLGSIYSSVILPKKIIIYDNNSSDKSIKIIKKFYPEVILLEGKKNLGFGNGNNKAMQYSNSEFILFVNNDVILDKNCTMRLLEGFNNKEIVILNPMIYRGWNKKEDHKIYAFGAEVNEDGFAYGLYNSKPDKNDLNCFSGACFMARAADIKGLKFESRFFLYYEEPELSIRILQQKKKIGRVSKAKSYHLESYSSPRKNIDGIAFRQFYGIQNRWFLLGKFWPARLLFKTIAYNILHLLYLTYFFLKNKKFSYLKLCYLAPLEFIKGLQSRAKKPPHDLFWHKKLSKLPISQYLTLRKKVFSNK